VVVTGSRIEALTNVKLDDADTARSVGEKTVMVRAARQLLSAITKVLILADRVVIKQLVMAKDQVSLLYAFHILSWYYIAVTSVFSNYFAIAVWGFCFVVLVLDVALLIIMLAHCVASLMSLFIGMQCTAPYTTTVRCVISFTKIIMVYLFISFCSKYAGLHTEDL